MAGDLIRSLYMDSIARPLPRQTDLLEKGAKLYANPDTKTFFAAYKVPIGIEVEVEGFDASKWGKSLYWKLDKDGSLKDDGAELISCPIAGKNIDYALAELAQIMGQQKPRWSHRCSVHVHINVRNWTTEDVRALVSTYAVFEDLFFHLVAEIRKGGSYSYPIRDLMPSSVIFGGKAGKYCAFNTSSSVSEHGTVEFRQMHGTSDTKALRRWIQLIVKLHHYVKRTPTKELIERISALNTNSQYYLFVKDVFGALAGIFPEAIFQSAMEEGVLWAKVYNYINGGK